MIAPDITEPDQVELKAHILTHTTVTEGEQLLFLYHVDISKEHPAGFYTRADEFVEVDDVLSFKEVDDILTFLNADLKRWLIFYGLPKAYSVGWWRVVIHHRDIPLPDKLASIRERYRTIEPILFPEANP